MKDRIYIECDRKDAHMIGCPLPEKDHRQVFLEETTLTELLESKGVTLESIVDILVEEVGPTESEMKVVSKDGWPLYNERIIGLAESILALLWGEK